MSDTLDPTQRATRPDADVSAAPIEPVPAADPFASTLTVASGCEPPAGPRLEPGRELGPVRLVREIGRGATGAVFQGLHTVLCRDVAVKFLIHVTAGSTDAEGIRRFVDEARAAASVRHPNLTQIFHADVDGVTPYLVLEYVHGPTLRQLLEHAGALSAQVAAVIVSDIAAAVAELHARGIIHRDIKPSNALVDSDGRVCVTDFGLAVRRSHSSPGSGASADIDFAGTPAYMAPEMFEGRISARSDVYAMGIMAFQLLAGSTPFSGAFHELRDKHAHDALPSHLLRALGVNPDVIEVVERATNKQAMFRYKTAPDFARALRQASGCGTAELARARKQLCDLVASHAVSKTEGGLGEKITTAGEVRIPRGAAAQDDADSTLYTETISRIATIKRERRRNPPADPDGSHLRLSPIGHDPPRGGAVDPVSVSSDPTTVPLPVGLQFAPPAIEGPDRVVPLPVLVVGLLGIVHASLVAVWVIGQLTGQLGTGLPVPLAAASPAAVIVLCIAALAYVPVIIVLLVTAIATLKLAHWARRLMIVYSLTDLFFQLLVLLVVIAWIEPLMVSTPSSPAAGQAAARSASDGSILRPWIIQWFVLSLYPACALYFMTRRRVRDAFDAAAPVAPEQDGTFPNPIF